MKLTRHTARKIERFTEAVTVATTPAPDGCTYTAFVVQIDGQLHGQIMEQREGDPLTEEAIAYGIVNFYQSLQQEGVIAA